MNRVLLARLVDLVIVLFGVSVIVFLMILVVAAGGLAFEKLGRDEDPAFTVRTMIVAAVCISRFGTPSASSIVGRTGRCPHTAVGVPEAAACFASRFIIFATPGRSSSPTSSDRIAQPSTCSPALRA